LFLDDFAEWLIGTGTLRGIVNCDWTCGALGMEALNLFGMLDERAERLFGNGIGIANCDLTCGVLGISLGSEFVWDARRKFGGHHNLRMSETSSRQSVTEGISLILIGREAHRHLVRKVRQESMLHFHTLFISMTTI
jgi:hypothetical protein